AGGPGGGAAAGPGGAAAGGQAGQQKPGQLADQSVLNIFLILYEEVATADPTVPLPAEEELRRIGLAGSLESAEARALLATLEAASNQARIGFPAGLRATRPVLAPPLPVAPAKTSATDP
ncbi:MAG: hypothetical protein Q8P41_04090, partial [Pseudomonadota bacterium]|nr:hypothetical protein [Pseudomonadota bacterium]